MTSPTRREPRDASGRRSALPRPAHRAVLVTHVIVSVGWLGLTVGLLTLAIAGAVSDSPTTDEMAYQAMNLFGDWLIIPCALLTFVSGLMLSLGTHWGLAQHRWVWTKFWLTLAAGLASVFALRPDLNQAAAAVAAGQPVDPVQLLVPPSVSLSLYLFMTGLSVLKPWGRTRRGRRVQATARRAAASRRTRHSAAA